MSTNFTWQDQVSIGLSNKAHRSLIDGLPELPRLDAITTKIINPKPHPLDFIQITIWRNEEPIDVTVDILSHYRGTNDFDDPTVVETSDVGVTDDGTDISLTVGEMEDAASIYLSQ